jgi:hypothetical protein
MAWLLLSWSAVAWGEPALFEAAAPILARHCLDCHNPSELKGGLDLTTAGGLAGGGDSGAVTHESVDESLLWQRVAAGEMPPEGALDETERESLRKWLAAGATWDSGPIDRFKYSSGKRAGYDWWSLQPVSRPNLPEVRNADWCRNEIDRFVLARLEQAGIEPAPAASARSLARRLALDLIGLPPDDAALIQAENDEGYGKLVDRLLGSRHHGERWARHWLDVVRFGESQGFEYDRMRPTAYRYRDWVIGALNDDLPYDEFVRQQLAGDVLYPGNTQATIASGFLVAGPWDEAGQRQQSAAMRAVVRQDELEDLLAVTSQTFLGLTVNCARCHDHKFDPITQVEYYQLAAALSGVVHGERPIAEKEFISHCRADAEALAKRSAQLRQALAGLEAPARERILAQRAIEAVETPVPEPLARWDFSYSSQDQVGGLHVELAGSARLEEGALRLAGELPWAKSIPLTQDLKEKTLEVWVQLDNLEQRGGAAMGIQSLDGAQFDAIVFGEQEPGKWMAGSDGFSRTQSFHGEMEAEATQRFVPLAIVYHADGRIEAYRDGQPYGRAYASGGPATFRAGKAQVVFGLRHVPVDPGRLLTGAVQRAQLYGRALSAAEVAASAGTTSRYVSGDEIVSELSAADQAQRGQWLREMEMLAEQERRAANTTTYAVTPKQSEPTHVLARGNPGQPLDVVSANGLKAVGVGAEWGLEPDVPEGEARRRLAEWITGKENPLFARVIANRLWHYHFGVGLVDTPNDFGFNGGRASHPELLDWLASELMAQGYRLKPIHRLIVTSATYRQAVARQAEGERIDADNRLLWRGSVRRIDAEALRDSMLFAAGELNLEAGGPGFFDFEAYQRSGTQFFAPRDLVGATFQRRSVYRTWARGGRSPLLDVFDCPDPSTTTPRRAVTTTPLQALAMWNGEFSLRMAEALAHRAEREAGESLEAQVARVYRLAWQRDATGDELQSGIELAREHGLPALCRVVFNSSEFLYVD